MRLCHARRNRANARRADQFDADTRARVNLFQVIDQLR